MACEERLESLQNRLGHKFENARFLIDALTHSSFVNENAGAVSNERMEFLGDSILSFVSARYLYEHYPLNEGRLSKLRSILVSEGSLYRIAVEYDIQKCMRFGKSLKNELIRTSSISQSILADCVEALIAAVFLDSGCDSAFAVVARMLDYLVNKVGVLEAADDKDYKSLLQEFVQKKTHDLPIYESRKIESSGKDASDVFEVSLFVSGRLICKHRSSSIKKGQRACAKEAYEMLAGE